MELSDRPLEAELAEIAERAEPGRTAHLAVRHWGWDGRGGATLEATGREFGGITRERVRQLCERLAQRIGDMPAEAPALERALVLAAHEGPHDRAASWRGASRTSASPHGHSTPPACSSAASVLGRAPTFTLQPVKDVRVVLPDPPDPASDTVAVIAAIVDTARALVRRAGAARVSDVTGRVAADLAVWVDDELVTAVVSEPADFVWLERRTSWFYLPSVAKNAVASRVTKVLSVTGAVSLADLHAGIRRDERMREFVMPEYILAELCARLPGVAVEGGLVVADEPRRPEDVLETTELTLVRALRDAGGEAGRHELERACLATGMKLASFNNRIAYSPIVEDLGQGRYGLRGAGAAGNGGGSSERSVGEAAQDADTPRPGELASLPATGPALRRRLPCSACASPPWHLRRCSPCCSSGCTASVITVIWAAAMAALLFLLWLATIPLRARQRSAWREMGLGPDGRPLPEEEDDAVAHDGDGDTPDDDGR